MHCIEDLINSILSCRTVIHNENEHERDQSKYHYYFPFIYASVRAHLVYITQVNSTFRTRWFASSEVISQVLFTSEQPKKNKMAFVGILSQIKSLLSAGYSPCVVYTNQLFTSVTVKVVDIYLAASRVCKYPPLFTSTSVNNC